MPTLDELNERGMGTLPGLIGLTILEAEEGKISSRLDLREELMAPNGYLHAATVVGHCGYLVRLRNVREPARRRTELHDHRTEVQLRRDETWGCYRVRSEARPRWPHDAGVGRNRLRRGERQAHSALSLHADDPVLALNIGRTKTVSP